MEKVFNSNLFPREKPSRHWFEIFYVILLPLSLIWGAATLLRRRYFPKSQVYHSKLPVISIGNLHSGGTGKTPLTHAIANYFSKENPSVVSRGYRGSLSSQGARVGLQGPHAVGDEPWMMHKVFGLPVWIGKNRVKSLKKIEETAKHRLVLLDDGFQHLKVHRDIDLVLIDSHKPIQKNFCLPLGELREPLSALKQATAVVLTGLDSGKNLEWKQMLKRDFPQLPIFEAELKVEGLYDEDKAQPDFRTKALYGFSGLASNEKFAETLLRFCPNARYGKSFGDHHAYTEEDVISLIGEGKTKGAEAFVTTDKDWVKVARHFKQNEELVLSLRIGYALDESFWDFLKKRLPC